jgi:DNA-binding CsgD family transcriptional regulator
MKEGLTTEEKQQIATLSADGWPAYRIAKQMNRSPHTVRRYLSQPEAITEVRNEKQELAVLYREKARACVAAIDDDKISKSSALQLATAAGICTDKALLLAGQPTVNVAVLLQICEAIRAKDDAESESQHQPAKALLSLPANSV